MTFNKEIGEIYRLKVPFENLYTSVFLIKTEQSNVLVDCATYASNVDEYIIPALNALGVHLTDIKYLILTHNHGDHMGGKARLLELAPKIKVVQAECPVFLNGITVCELKGHTIDSIGVFDERTGTLISGDALQGAGIGKWRCLLESKGEYLKTINKIKQDKRIKNILFSHAYEPWEKCSIFGRGAVLRILKDCKNYIIGE